MCFRNHFGFEINVLMQTFCSVGRVHYRANPAHWRIYFTSILYWGREVAEHFNNHCSKRFEAGVNNQLSAHSL